MSVYSLRYFCIESRLFVEEILPFLQGLSSRPRSEPPYSFYYLRPYMFYRPYRRYFVPFSISISGPVPGLVL